MTGGGLAELDAGGDAPIGVVGAGLIGTSVALAVRQSGRRALLRDADSATQAQGCALSGATPWSVERVPLALVAVPLPAEQNVVEDLLTSRVASTVTTVGSVMAAGRLDAPLERRLIRGHPMAGAEGGGPENARAGLFYGRAWMLEQETAAGADAYQAVERFVVSLGATPVAVTADAHNRAVAATSHLAQVLSSALAITAVDVAGRAKVALEAVAGPNLLTMTRTAASSPAMWADIVGENAQSLEAALSHFDAILEPLRAALASQGSPRVLHPRARRDGQAPVGPARVTDVKAAMSSLVAGGNKARTALPAKGRRTAAKTTVLYVPLSDQPAALSDLLNRVSSAGINIEDLAVEHAPLAAHGVAVLTLDANDKKVKQFVDKMTQSASEDLNPHPGGAAVSDE